MSLAVLSYWPSFFFVFLPFNSKSNIWVAEWAFGYGNVSIQQKSLKLFVECCLKRALQNERMASGNSVLVEWKALFIFCYP